MIYFHLPRFGCFFIICSLNAYKIFSQSSVKPIRDTSYYETFPESIIGRIYLSQKYATLELKDGNDAPRIRYRPNSTIGIGAGATYRTISVNLAYGFGFINNDKEKGKTQKLDIQARLYGRKWAIDLFGQLYEGYFLYPKGRALPNAEKYYLRPDLKLTLVEASAYRIFNYSKFTLRPAFVQDEWQKKSAGSFLAGAAVYYSDFHGDSALVPSVLTPFYDSRGIRGVRFLELGPGAGYAYTQVLPYHFFLSGSVTFNLNLGFINETGLTGSTNHISANAGLIYRMAAGFSNGNLTINFFWINSKVIAKGDESGNRYVLNSGTMRLIFARRFHPGPRVKKYLKYIDMLPIPQL